MEIYTIGFTRKSADRFFGLLRAHDIRRMLDVRLNNVSQLAGFSKKDDLAFFLRELLGVEYLHEPMLAPTQHMLDALKKGRGSWIEYERSFMNLMAEREIERRLDPDSFRERTALLCSESTAEHCHRRLVVEYLNDHWGDVGAVHI